MDVEGSVGARGVSIYAEASSDTRSVIGCAEVPSDSLRAIDRTEVSIDARCVEELIYTNIHVMTACRSRHYDLLNNINPTRVLTGA